jgi:hypothetical protein
VPKSNQRRKKKRKVTREELNTVRGAVVHTVSYRGSTSQYCALDSTSIDKLKTYRDDSFLYPQSVILSFRIQRSA